MRSVSYYLKINDTLYNVFSVEGDDGLSAVYRLQVCVVDLGLEDITGANAELGYCQAQPDNTRCSYHALYQSVIVSIWRSSGYIFFILQPAWARLQYNRLLGNEVESTVASWLKKRCRALAYDSDHCRCLFANRNILRPLERGMADNELSLCRKLCFEAGLSYSFRAQSGAEMIIFFDHQQCDLFKKSEFSYTTHCLWWQHESSAVDWLRDVVVLQKRVPHQVGVWSALNWQQRLSFHSKSNKNQIHATDCWQKNYFPLSTASDVAADEMSQRLYQWQRQDKRMIRCQTSGRPYLPGDQITLAGQDFPLSVSRSYFVARVSFSFSAKQVQQTLWLQPSCEKHYSVNSAETIASSHFISRWQVASKSGSVLDEDGSYYCRDIDRSCHGRVTAQKEISSAFWSAVPSRALWTAAPIAVSAEKAGCHIPHDEDEQVLVERMFASFNAPCIMAADSFSATNTAHSDPLAGDDKSLPAGSDSPWWQWQGKKQQSLSLSARMPCFNMQLKNKDQSCNKIIVYQQNPAGRTSSLNSTDRTSSLNSASARTENQSKITIDSDRQDIIFYASANLSLVADGAITMEHQHSVVQSGWSMRLSSHRNRLQAQAKVAINWSAKNALYDTASGDAHSYAQKNILLSAEVGIQLTAARDVFFKTRSLQVNGLKVRIATSASSLILQVGSSVIILRPGMIGFFATQISVSALATYAGKVSRLPSPLPAAVVGGGQQARVARMIEVMRMRPVLCCTELSWDKQHYSQRSQVTGSLCCLFEDGADKKRVTTIEIIIALKILSKHGSIDSHAAPQHVLKKITLKINPGQAYYSFSFSLAQVSWRDQIAAFSQSTLYRKRWLLFFSAHYNGHAVSVLRPASLLWDLSIDVVYWQGGKHWRSQRPYAFVCNERSTAQIPFAKQVVWTLRDKQSCSFPYLNHLKSGDYDMQLFSSPDLAESDKAGLVGKEHAGASLVAVEDNEKDSLKAAVGLEGLSASKDGREWYVGPACHVRVPCLHKKPANKNINGSDKKNDPFHVDCHVLAPPIIIRLPLHDSTPSRPRLSDDEMKQLSAAGGKVTVFVHGYNVPFGSFKQYLCAHTFNNGEPSANTDDYNAMLAQSLGFKMDNSGVYQSIDDLALRRGHSEAEISVYSEAWLRDVGVHPPHDKKNEKQSALALMPGWMDDPVTTTHAHSWLQRVEYYLNRACGFSNKDFRQYRRIVLIAWPSVVDGMMDYADGMHHAQHAGIQLASVLAQMRQHNLDVSIIAHSLGGAVACVAAHTLYAKYKLTIRQLILWQAAVPNTILEQGLSSSFAGRETAGLGDGKHAPHGLSDNKVDQNSANSLGDVNADQTCTNSLGDVNADQTCVDSSGVATDGFWHVPCLWQAVNKILVIHSRFDNILGPIDLSSVNDVRRQKILSAKPFMSEAMTTLYLSKLGLGSVYKLAVWFGFPPHYFLSLDHQAIIYKHWLKHGASLQARARLPATFNQYFISERQTSGDVHCAGLCVDAKRVLSPEVLGLGGMWQAPTLTDGWWWRHVETLIRQGWRLGRLWRDIEGLVLLSSLIIADSSYQLAPALGFAGPDMTCSKLVHLQHMGRLKVIDGSDYLWQHSAMHDANAEIMHHVYKVIVNRLPGFQ